MIELSPLARLLTYVFLVSVMLSVGLEVTGRQVLDALRNVRLMGRALLANLVLVPILGLVLVRLIPMAPDVAAGVLILAAAPGAPFAVQFTSKVRDPPPRSARGAEMHGWAPRRFRVAMARQ